MWCGIIGKVLMWCDNWFAVLCGVSYCVALCYAFMSSLMLRDIVSYSVCCVVCCHVVWYGMV